MCLTRPECLPPLERNSSPYPLSRIASFPLEPSFLLEGGGYLIHSNDGHSPPNLIPLASFSA